MMSILLETAHSEPAVPTFVVAVMAFVALMAALIWVVGMGSGRPHSK